MIRLQVGARVNWVGAAGRAGGIIRSIDQDSAGQPWVTIDTRTPLTRNYQVRMPATSEHLHQIQMNVQNR